MLPRRRMDLVGGSGAAPYLAANAHPFPCGKDLDNLLKFVMDPFETRLYRNDTDKEYIPGSMTLILQCALKTP
jgi:hypothetical protein